MAEHSKIEWTDATWNPVRGCSRVSPGCGGPGKAGGCYAEAIAGRFSQPGQWGYGFAEVHNGEARWTGRVDLIESRLPLPLQWKRPRRIFVNSTSDLFHEKLHDEAIDRVFAVMALCPQHIFQVLTKRAERMREYIHQVTAESSDAMCERFAPAMRYQWPKNWRGPERLRVMEFPRIEYGTERVA